MINLSIISLQIVPDQMNVGHFGRGHFGLGRFGLDISAMEDAKGGRFGHNHKLWVGMCACINV